ncbi:MAG: metal-dependent transcriptional regulator [Gemmatimonadetes bacterium]|nr:metal-dependent transcriptional regulator [Gemmatimonadota bacterium]
MSRAEPGGRRHAAQQAPELTGQAEDYLKAIYELEQGDAAAGTNAVASRLGIAAASVSGMLQRLARLGLVHTERYRGTRLTESGRAVALQLIRRHRIIESYLVSRLGFAWDDVHDEAERLEHAASTELIERMAHDLGNPTADPHGAPIPTVEGKVDERRFGSLASLEVGATARVSRMSDRDATLLRYLAARGIRPGASVRVVSREAFDGPIVVTVDRKQRTISPAAAANVWVEGEAAAVHTKRSAGASGRSSARRKR